MSQFRSPMITLDSSLLSFRTSSLVVCSKTSKNVLTIKAQNSVTYRLRTVHFLRG